MITKLALIMGCWGASMAISAMAAEPVMRVVKAAQTGVALLGNGNFEDLDNGRPRGWQAATKGFQLVEREGRADSRALVCDNPSPEGWFGASQILALNRATTAPLVVRGWSKAQNVTGSADSGYSLYVDLTYNDGTPLWGQTVNFRCGTHDWEQREFVILPEKPVKSLTLHCIFRGHAGKVWFDDVEVTEVKAQDGAMLFEGVPLQMASAQPLSSPLPPKSYATADDLTLMMRDHTVASLRTGQREWAGKAPSGFLARDVAAHSDIFGFANGACPELGLKVQADYLAQSNCVVVRGKASDTLRRDRAVTLLFALPVDATGWRWGDDIRRSRVIQGNGEFANSVSVQCGATGAMSLYPLAAIWNDQAGLALALDMAQPALYRLVYHPGAKQLFVAYDFGLAPDTERFPGSAEFRFVIYRFDPRWGFRAAFQKLQEIFPEHFVVRSQSQGLWMPFTDVSKVQGWEDFGFRYHEGNNNVPWDDAHGVLSFRYTEPMTWWMRMNKDVPRTPAAALAIRDELARGTDKNARPMAEISRSAAMFDEDGQPSLQFQDTPWCNGAVWSLNPNPRLPASPNGATVHWDGSIKERLYGAGAKGVLDGEYLDSLEGYVTANLNFRRDHFRHTTVPLTFSRDTQQPVLFKGLAVAEFTRWIADDVHRMGKLMFANGVPYRFTFLCPWLDVLGTETDWLRNGKYAPASDSTMSLWRAMSGAKPYLLLMNTDYDTFVPALVEKYFQRALFYGMWPGMFSHNAADNPYWQNPKWYNRDRSLFKKYLPLIKQVAEAGWQPVTRAACDNEKIFVERFGPDAQGTVYYTLLNDTTEPQTGVFTILDANASTRAGQETVTDLVSGRVLPAEKNGWKVVLEPQEVVVVRRK